MVSDAGGVLLVPSFAIGRTQEIVYALDRLLEAGKIPQLPLYLDSPMASKASDIYRRHADYFDDETRRLLEHGDTPLDYPNQTETRDVHDSQKIAQAQRPYMIVASNGMLTGGRVLGHLRNLIDDPAATLLFVGYQGVGTLGAHLQAGATTVKLDGQVRQVRCKVRSISGFSAHADESELLAWLGHFARGQEGRRRRLPADGLPRPRRSRGPDRDGAEGPGPRLHDEDPALARGRDARVGRSAEAGARSTAAVACDGTAGPRDGTREALESGRVTIPAMPATPPTASAIALGLLDPAELEAVRRPFKAARLLPPRVFHDPAILDYEQVNWFGRDWICVGRAEEAANRGEYFLATVAGENVMVLRGARRRAPRVPQRLPPPRLDDPRGDAAASSSGSSARTTPGPTTSRAASSGRSTPTTSSTSSRPRTASCPSAASSGRASSS